MNIKELKKDFLKYEILGAATNVPELIRKWRIMNVDPTDVLEQIRVEKGLTLRLDHEQMEIFGEKICRTCYQWEKTKCFGYSKMCEKANERAAVRMLGKIMETRIKYYKKGQLQTLNLPWNVNKSFFDRDIYGQTELTNAAKIKQVQEELAEWERHGQDPLHVLENVCKEKYEFEQVDRGNYGKWTTLKILNLKGDYEERAFVQVPPTLRTKKGLALMVIGGMCHTGSEYEEFYRDYYVKKMREAGIHEELINGLTKIEDYDTEGIGETP